MGDRHPKTDLERGIEDILETRRRYFWDKGPLDHKRDNYIIIERILEFGTEDEVGVIQDYYGIEAIKAVVKESRALSPRTVNYFSWLFGISRGETKCFSDASRRTWQPY
jgi:hypothetical protein